MSKKINKNHAAHYLTLLAWHDALEKLDMIILEIRHLQVSIINSLREPDLYRNLRYEEAYLWDGEFMGQGMPVINLIEKAILLYPTTDEFDDPNIQEKQQQINKNIKKIWFKHTWGREQKRHYYFLHGLQLLKRDIFNNKLILCEFATRIKLHQKNIITNEDKAKFIILRGGVLSQLTNYIEHLQNYQNAFSKDLDIGEQNHPRPSLERRRELGVYMDFLADRTKNIHRDMTFFLKEFDKDFKSFRESPLIFHRWTHGVSSETSYMDNETKDALAFNQRLDNKSLPSSIHFVTTSYFMPERPDLQPIIAHEVGHAIVRDYFDNYSPTGIGRSSNDFSTLLALLQDTISSFKEKNQQLPNISDVSTRDFMQELTCDLLALSVKGMCYLYAFFLETISFNVERLLEGEQGKINLNIINQLNTISLRRILSFDWYIRYQVMIIWMKKIHHHDLCYLDQVLMDGMEHFVQDLDQTLYNLAPEDEKCAFLLWKKLSKRLIDIIEKSPATEVAKAWRKKRCDDGEKEDGSKTDCLRQYPRSMMRLDKRIRDELYVLQLKMKTAEYRPLEEDCNNLIKELGIQKEELWSLNPEKLKPLHHAFENFYGVTYKTNNANKKNIYPLYRHLYDIPWQSSLMRSMDVLRDRPLTATVLLQQMHFSFPLGRELFEMALEFYLWKSETASFRLANIYHLLDEILHPSDTSYTDRGEIMRIKNDNRLLEKIKTWLGSENNLPEELLSCAKRLDILVKKNRNKHIKIDQLEEKLPWEGERALAVKLLLQLHPSIPKSKSHQKRLVERISGKKINVLYKILKGEFNLPDILKPLLLYIKINKPDERKYFYSTLLSAFRQKNQQEGYKNWMIARLSLTGKNPLSSDTKSYQYGHLCKNKQHILRQSMLGRYDIVMLSKSRPLCRCPLPSFYENQDITKEIAITMNEKFSSFFVRREFVRYVSLSPENNWFDVNQEQQEVTAYIVITLQHRLYRLNFLYRLIKAIENKSSENFEIIENIGNLFKPSDFCFLTDGWGDIIICFTDSTKKPLNKKRIKDIFNIQNAVYQDFMVDRTELIFSPRVINHLVEENQVGSKKAYEIKVQVRMLEDRQLSLSNQYFIEDFKKNKKNICKGNNPFFKNINIFKIPGRMDFIITFDGCDQAAQQTDFYNILRKLLNSEYIRNTDTSLCQRVDLS